MGCLPTILANSELGRNLNLTENLQFSSMEALKNYMAQQDFLEDGVVQEIENARIFPSDELLDPKVLKPSMETKKQVLLNTQGRLDLEIREMGRSLKNPLVVKNKEKYRELMKSLSDRKKRLEKVNEDLATIKSKGQFANLIEAVKNDINHIEKLVESKYFNDHIEAEQMLNMYISIQPYSEKLGYKNAFFSENEMYNPDSSLKPEFVEFYKDYQEFVIKAETLSARLYNNKRNLIKELINEDFRVRQAYEKELTEEDIFKTHGGLKDINIMTAYVMSPEFQFGFTDDPNNGILPQISQSLLYDAVYGERGFATYIDNRLKKPDKDGVSLEVRVKKLLKSKFPKDGFRKFIGKTADGRLADYYVSKYSFKMREEKSKHTSHISRELQRINQIPDIHQKSSERLKLQRDIFNWHRERYDFMDIRKISEVFNDVAFKSIFGDNHNLVEDTAYVNSLKERLGEYMYAKEVEEQKTLLRRYIISLELEMENHIGKSDIDLIKAQNTFEERHNPLKILQILDDYETNVHRYPPQAIFYHHDIYTQAIPKKTLGVVKNRKLRDTGEDTGYFDSNFDDIENNPDLLEYHDIISEFEGYMHNNIPIDQRHRLNPFSLPALEKTLIELLSDPDLHLLQKVSRGVSISWERLKQSFKTDIREYLAVIETDPTTGKEVKKIRAEFLRYNKPTIEKKVKELQLVIAMKSGKKYDYLVPKTDINNLNEIAIDILARVLGIDSNIESIKKAFESYDHESFDFNKALKEAVTSLVVQESSMDLSKVMRSVSHMAALFVARQRAYPILKAIRDSYINIRQSRVNQMGEPELKDGKPITDEHTRHYAVKQYESWFNRNVLGDMSKKSSIGIFGKRPKKTGIKAIDDRLDKYREERDSKEEQRRIQREEKMYETLNQEKKDIIDFLDKNREDLKFKDEIGSISTEHAQDEIKKIDKQIAIFQNKGAQYTYVSVAQRLFDFIRFLGLGYNFSAAMTNFFEGQFSNLVNMQRYFDDDIIHRVSQMNKGAMLRNFSFGNLTHRNTPFMKETLLEADMVRFFMDNLDILQDVYDEFQRASMDSKIRTMDKNFRSKEIVSRVEYLNQAPIMLAVILDTKIANRNGDIVSLWDAYVEGYKEFGKFGVLPSSFDEDIASKYTISTETTEVTPEIKYLREKTTDLIIKMHGDYSELSGNMMSETIEGMAIMMFKRWLGSYIYSRFGSEHVNIHTGKIEKGRYKSLTAPTGTLMFGALGLTFFGPLGTLFGGGLGFMVGLLNPFAQSHRKQEATMVTFLEEMVEGFKMIGKQFLGLPVNVAFGRNVIKNYDPKIMKENYSDVDFKNMRANMAQTALLLWLLVMILIIKGLAYDDDDEKDSKRRVIHNVLVNKFMGFQQEIGAFMTPGTLHDTFISGDGIAVYRFFTNIGKTIGELVNYLQGDTYYTTGVNAGEHRLATQTTKTFLPSPIRSVIAGDMVAWGFSSLIRRQFQPTPFDDYFRNPDNLAEEELKHFRTEKRLEMGYYKKGVSEEEKDRINKIIRQNYSKPKELSHYEFWEKLQEEEKKKKRSK